MRRRTENFTDRIARLYPELHGGKDRRGNNILSKVVTFQVTDACNLRCTYCYQNNKGHKVMSWDTAKKFVDLILSGDKGFKDYINPETSPGIVLDFIGGEPTLQIELIDRIIDYFRDQALLQGSPWAVRYMTDICSNGTTYQNPNVQRLLKKHERHLSFSVSLDGDKALHDSCRVFPDGSGSYDLAEYAAKDWMSNGHFMGSKITISPQNVMHAFSATKHMLDLGYEEINMNCVFEEGWKESDGTILYQQLKKIADYMLENDLEDNYFAMFEENFFHPKPYDDDDNWCGGTGSMLACDPDGNLFPCIRYMDSSLNGHQPALKIGNVDDGLLQKPEEAQIIKCMDCVTRTSQSTQECIDCPIAEGCAWCFEAGTVVNTPDGFKNIEDIKVGDKVLDMTGTPQNVIRATSHVDNDLCVVKACGFKDTVVTKPHPFWTKRSTGEVGWVAAGDLNITDKIALYDPDSTDKKTWVKVCEPIREVPDSIEVFNIEVENNPTYIANGALVHNCSGYNYEKFGTVNHRATYICPMHKARSLANVYYWNKCYQKHHENKKFKMYCPKEWAVPIIGEEEYAMLKELSEE